MKKLYVDIGDKVSEGQILAELEAPELQAQSMEAVAKYKSAEATYIASNSNFTRLVHTSKTPGTVSPNDLDFAKAKAVSDSLNMQAAKASCDAVTQLASYLKMTAPFTGVITYRSVGPGTFVGPLEKTVTPIYKIKQVDKLRLHIAIPEKYTSEIKIGNNVKFKVSSLPTDTFIGKIDRLADEIEKNTRSEMVEVEIDNKSEKLLPGMYAYAMVAIKRPEVHALPLAAVTQIGNQSFCYFLHDGKAVQMTIQTGPNDGKWIEVDNKKVQNNWVTFTGDEQIIVGDLAEISDGQAVDVVESSPTSSKAP